MVVDLKKCYVQKIKKFLGDIAKNNPQKPNFFQMGRVDRQLLARKENRR